MKFTNENEVSLTGAEYEALARKAKIADRLLAKDPALIEALAALAHTTWAEWMTYQWQNERLAHTGNREWNPDRWRRQVATDYEKLPDIEKGPDREIARKAIEVILQK